MLSFHKCWSGMFQHREFVVRCSHLVCDVYTPSASEVNSTSSLMSTTCRTLESEVNTDPEKRAINSPLGYNHSPMSFSSRGETQDRP